MSLKCEGKVFLFGTIMGAFFGMMFAPKSGKEMRECFYDWMEGMDQDFQKKVKDLEREIMAFDKEKTLKNAKTKADTLLKKTDELMDSAVQKGNSKLKKMADDVQKKAIVMTESVLDHLE